MVDVEEQFHKGVMEENERGPPPGYSKFVTDLSMLKYATHWFPPEDELSGKKWYWFNDMSGLKWTPYREVDCQKLNQAWKNNQKSCLIVNGDYRVEFNRDNPSNPAGNQYSNRQNNPGGRTVVCSEPTNEIHGVEVSKHPL